MLRSKLNNNYQAIVIAFDIEHIMLVAHIIHRIECLLDILQAFPIAYNR